MEYLTANSEVEFFTSEKAKEELEKTAIQTTRSLLASIYNLFQKVPQTNFIVSVSGTLGSMPLGSFALGGGGSVEHPQFTQLKQIFDRDDAEHIFQAEMNNLDYFLTLDEKTILRRATDNLEKLKAQRLRIEFVSPHKLQEIIAQH